MQLGYSFTEDCFQVFYGTEQSNTCANRGNSFFLTIIPNMGYKLCLQSLFHPQLCYKSIVFPINNTWEQLQVCLRMKKKKVKADEMSSE